VTPRPPRTCQGCEHKFTPYGPDDRFCSNICAGNTAMTQLLTAMQNAARTTTRSTT
jgi:hypothetical protein